MSRPEQPRDPAPRSPLRPVALGVAALALAGLVVMAFAAAPAPRQLPSASTTASPAVARPGIDRAWADGELRLGIVGDSITHGWMADTERSTYREQVRTAPGYPGRLTLDWVAVPGATSAEMAPLALGLLARSEAVLIATGTNDSAVRLDLAILEAGYPPLLAAVPDDAVLLCLGPWLSPQKANERMRELCTEAGGRYIDVSDLGALRGPPGEPAFPFERDEFHPNQAGHDAIAERVIAAITP